MAIGDTVQAGLMRVDSSPIQIAGAAQARANQAFGQAVEKTAIGFFQGQAKKKKTQEAIQGLAKLFPDAPPELLRAMAKNPEVMQAKQQQDQLSQQMDIAKMRDATQRSEGGANRAQTASIQEDAKNLREEQKAENNKFFSTLSASVPTDQLTPEAIERIDRFNTAVGPDDPRRRAEVNDPQAFMERVKGDPSSYVQKPVYELQGRDFLSQFDDPGMFQRALAFQQANQPKSLSPTEQLAREEFEYRKSQDLNKPNLTDGEKSRDKKFGDQLVEFNLPDINKGLEQLTEASEALSKSNTLTGPIVSLMPNFVGDRVNPKAAEVREAVEEVVQRNLRLVLGSQFTEKEGERLISRAYNPTLDEAENKKRVERLIKSIKDAAQEKLNMKSYFEKNGTLKGYDSKSPSIESIEQSAFRESAPAPQSILDEIDRKKQLRSKRAGL
jgi:hypothetical protein